MPGAGRLDHRHQRHPALFLPVWSAFEYWACHDPNSGNDGSAGGCNRGLFPGTVLHRSAQCERNKPGQSAILHQRRCRRDSKCLQKYGVCHDSFCYTKRTRRKAACSLRFDHPPAGCQSPTGFHRTAGPGLYAVSLRKEAGHLPQNRQPLPYGGYGAYLSAAGSTGSSTAPCVR